MLGKRKHLLKWYFGGAAGMALFLSACGSSGPGSASGHTAPTPPTTSTTRPHPIPPTTTSTLPPKKVQPGRYPASASPCSYVSAKQVSQFTGQPVTAQEVSLLNPAGAFRCVYQIGKTTKGALPNTISLTHYSNAQLAHFSETAASYVASHTRGATPVQIQGHPGYSLNNGNAYLVSVGGVLNVAGSQQDPKNASTVQQITTAATSKIAS